MERHMDYRKFKSINRRELLRLTPVVALGAFAIPKVQEPLLNTGLAFSDWASKVLFRSPAGQPRNGLELVAFFLWHRNRGHGPGGYIRISIGHRMAHDFSDAYHRSAARGSRIHQGRSARSDFGLVIVAGGSGHLDSLPTLDGLCAFVDAAPAKVTLSFRPPEEIRKLTVDPAGTIIHDLPVTFC
jgi:hypothetical protein